MGIAPAHYDCFGRVSIGNNVFIGTDVIIMKGVTIGDNCVIGAGAVVTKNIPSGSVACGVPARVIGTVQDYYASKVGKGLYDTSGWNAWEKRLLLQKEFVE